MEDIRMIATDLDGTLLGNVDEFPLYADFRDRLAVLKRENGAVWAVCTGRTFRSYWRLFGPMKAMGILPDVVIVRHAFIYTRCCFGYWPHVIWNIRVLLLVWLDRVSSRQAIDEWHDLITRMTQGVKTVRRKRDRLWLRFSTEESALFAAGELRKRVVGYRHFRVFHYQKEVDVRSVPFTKGMAVRELARRLDVSRKHLPAIGNGHNDISLLDGDVAQFVGCPANSEPEVMEVVHKAGGHVATGRSLTGVVEIMDAFIEGKVCSDLPAWWEDPSEGDNPWPNRPRGRHRRRNFFANILLGGAVVYTALLVFANFDLLPGCSNFIMRPYRSLLSIVEIYCTDILEWFYNVR